MKVVDVAAIIGLITGVIVISGALVTIAKGVFGQINATHENTQALNRVNISIAKLDTRVDQHDIDIAVLKDKAGVK